MVESEPCAVGPDCYRIANSATADRVSIVGALGALAEPGAVRARVERTPVWCADGTTV
jgi:hypothetical protein